MSQVLGKTAHYDPFFPQQNSTEPSVGEAGIDRLGTAVRKRDEVAHKTPPPITFRELEETYQAATAIVAAVRQTLLP